MSHDSNMTDHENTPFRYVSYCLDDCAPRAGLIACDVPDPKDGDWGAIHQSLAMLRESFWGKYDNPSPTCLYRYYDRAGCLLYVGISNDFGRRDTQHITGTLWRHAAEYVRFEIFPFSHVAEVIEAKAIKDENPEYNIKIPNPFGLNRKNYIKYFGDTKGMLRGEGVYWLDLRGPVPTPCAPRCPQDGTAEEMTAARNKRQEDALERMRYVMSRR